MTAQCLRQRLRIRPTLDTSQVILFGDGMADKNAMRVLIIDDEKNIRSTLAVCVEGLGCEAQAVGSSVAAVAALEARAYDLAFLDLRLGQENGIQVLAQLLAVAPSLAIVIITAYATVDSAVEAIKKGAWDYLPKPFTPPQIRLIVERCRERQAAAGRLAELESHLASLSPGIILDSCSPRMRPVLETLARAANSEVPVLFRGETGTGKSVFARALHSRSPRRAHPLVVVNCPTLSAELVASELFGHSRGAFTGAVKDQAGKVEAAQGGTIFLDEIGEIPPSLQAKLLRFLQDKEFERVGETRTRRADVRLISATNRDLENDLQKGRFREDLLYRLNIIEIVVPSLRERAEDILPLAKAFLRFFGTSLGRPDVELSLAAEELLVNYSWPGNVRELRNTMERALILWPASVVEPAAFPERMQQATTAGPAVGGDFTLEEIEREHIQRVVARCKTQEAAASILGVDATTLWRKRKKTSSE